MTTVTCPCARSFRRWVSPVLESKRVGPVSARGTAPRRTAARISPRASLTQEFHSAVDSWGAMAARIESPKVAGLLGLGGALPLGPSGFQNGKGGGWGRGENFGGGGLFKKKKKEQ